MQLSINLVCVSAVASQSVNDVFSATYDNYMLLLNINSHSAIDKDVRLRMRASGTDESSAQYFYQFNAMTQANTTDNFRDSNATSFFTSTLDSLTTGAFFTTTFQIRNPFASSATTFFTDINGINNVTSNITTYRGGGVLNTTTSYSGFSLIVSAGNITGNVSVYGFNK